MKNELGRKARRRWGWFALILGLAFIYFQWFVPNFGWGGGAISALFSLLFELFIFMMFAVMQFVAIFWFLGRARVYWLGPGESGVTFADYRGNREILDLAGRVVTLLRGVKTFKEMGGEVPRGLLLVGPPGTGKSYLAQAIATEAGVPFCYSSAPSFQNMFFGVGNLRIMMIYNAARKKAREHGAAIVFIDEIDAIGMSRSAQSGSMGIFGGGLGLLNELLLQMDPPTIDYSWGGRMMRMIGLRRGKAQTFPVLTIGATNLPDVLDTALLRPGRFDQKLTIDAPDMVGRVDILQYYLGKTKHEEDFPVERAAGDTIGYTPVMIKHVINEAAVFAHFAGRERVGYADFTAAREGYEWGLRQPIQRMNTEDRRRLAYHEAGHAVAQYLLLPSERVVKVTIVRHGRALGLSASKPLEERHTQSEAEIMSEIEVNLASRAAEEIFLGMKLNGVTQDLTTATHLAAAAIGWFGMDGSLYSYRAFNETLPDASAKRRIDRLLDRAYRSVYALLDANRPFVEAVARGLMEHEELTGEEVGELAQRTEATLVPGMREAAVGAGARAALPQALPQAAVAPALPPAAVSPALPPATVPHAAAVPPAAEPPAEPRRPD